MMETQESVFSGFFLALECSLIQIDFSGNKERYTTGAENRRGLGPGPGRVWVWATLGFS